jgi:cytochrome c oxidase subunit 2
MSVVKRMRPFVAPLLALLVLAISGSALAAVQPESSMWGFPKDVSVDGWRIDQLINVTSVFVVILFVIMCVWMVWATIAHGEKHEAEYDHGSARQHILAALGISILIFVVVDGNLFINSMIDLEEAFWNFEKAEADPGVVRIEINARQWAWQGRYAGNDGEFNTPDDVTVLNHFKIPMGSAVIMQLGAVDVIHSLYLPNLRVKSDVIPGTLTKVWFTATETGDFDIGCAQHCGTNHYKMRGMLTILTRNDFDRWLSEASQAAEKTFDPKDTGAQWGWTWKKS